jgi:hypothetical protein
MIRDAALMRCSSARSLQLEMGARTGRTVDIACAILVKRTHVAKGQQRAWEERMLL